MIAACQSISSPFCIVSISFESDRSKPSMEGEKKGVKILDKSSKDVAIIMLEHVLFPFYIKFPLAHVYIANRVDEQGNQSREREMEAKREGTE
jgi:hypothetical protein